MSERQQVVRTRQLTLSKSMPVRQLSHMPMKIDLPFQVNSRWNRTKLDVQSFSAKLAQPHEGQRMWLVPIIQSHAGNAYHPGTGIVLSDFIQSLTKSPPRLDHVYKHLITEPVSIHEIDELQFGGQARRIIATTARKSAQEPVGNRPCLPTGMNLEMCQDRHFLEAAYQVVF